MRLVMLAAGLAGAVSIAMLGPVANAEGQASAARASCLSPPQLAPLAERREAAISSTQSSQPLSILAGELQYGMRGSEVDWAEAVRLNRLLMERTQHFELPAHAAHLWRSAARQTREMHERGLYGVQVDFDEIERIFQMEEAKGIDVSEDRARTNRLMQGYDDLTRGLNAARRGEDAVARDLFLRAAEAGFVHAQFIAGRMYLDGGHGVRANAVEARRWFALAVDAGHVDAMYYLAHLYFTAPPGIIENKRHAVDLFVRAAQRNHAYAMLALGVSFERAQGGLARNVGEARCWYRRALDAGNDWDGSRQEAQASLNRL